MMKRKQLPRADVEFKQRKMALFGIEKLKFEGIGKNFGSTGGSVWLSAVLVGPTEHAL